MVTNKMKSFEQTGAQGQVLQSTILEQALKVSTIFREVKREELYKVKKKLEEQIENKNNELEDVPTMGI